MTDNDIIKALEICIGFVSGGEAMCNNCPLHDCDNCSSEKLKQALDLINRQQAEIEKLETIERFATKIIEKQTAEIERLEGKVKKLGKEQYDLCSQIVNLKDNVKYSKSEAIKEFAEKLKAYFEDEFIDNLVKEMTEEKE